VIRRRVCAAGLATGLALARFPAAAEAPERVWRIGILRPTSPPLPTDTTWTGIPRALRQIGYVEGRNLVLEHRYASGNPEQLVPLARELAAARVDLVVAVSAAAAKAAREVSATWPIVMFGNFDPVAVGLVANLARPGGNVTGVVIAPDGTLAGKRLELLRQVVPAAHRIAYLSPPPDASSALQLAEARKAASELGVTLVDAEVRDGDYERAFAALVAQRPGALLVAAHTLFVRDRARIIALAARHRLPAIYEWREQVVDGGLMTYSTSLGWTYERVAWFVDRILKGTRPADLAVERPSKFELVINQRTAQALGITIPQAVLLRTDEVIQ
jgi:putative tryptophan/tyrosine transport system substrate-binding protein